MILSYFFETIGAVHGKINGRCLDMWNIHLVLVQVHVYIYTYKYSSEFHEHENFLCNSPQILPVHVTGISKVAVVLNNT